MEPVSIQEISGQDLPSEMSWLDVDCLLIHDPITTLHQVPSPTAGFLVLGTGPYKVKLHDNDISETTRSIAS